VSEFTLLLKTEGLGMNDYSGCLCIFGLLAIAFLIWLVVRLSKPMGVPTQQIGKNRAPSPYRETVQRGTTRKNERFIEIIPGVQSSTPRVTLSYTFETGASSFVKDAQKYHEIEGKPVPPTTFMQYWPTFQAFNLEQKKWYLYWRSEIRQGRYPETDLSYIFVYVYELLCLVEIIDPAKAAEQIKIIWKAYRPQYPKLDHYFPDWGGDLVTAKVGITQGIAWWWELMTKDGIQPPAAIINVIIQKAVEDGKINELPYSVWAGLNLYHPQNKFYQRYNQDGAIDRGYLKSIYTIDRYFLSLKTPKGLLERYTPPKLYLQTKAGFTSAIVPDTYPKRISFGEARKFAGSSRLGNLLAAITKYTENILRKQNRFPARLSGFELEEKLHRVVDEAFAAPPEKKAEEPVRMSLDTGRIETLHQESEQVSEMLESKANEVAKPLYSDIAEVRSLWETLDLPARRLLLAIYAHKIEDISQVTADIIGAEISPFVLVDRINNPSIPLLGDRIISVENRKQVMIADDFIDEMELIAKENPLESMTVTSAEQPMSEAEDLWQRFLQQLSEDESDLLSQFVSSDSLSEAEIETFARSRGQMGNLLIDSISEKAIEQLGRTPFYPEDSCWFVEEEDLDVLREIVCVEGA
jgi:hypothetical protein